MLFDDFMCQGMYRETKQTSRPRSKVWKTHEMNSRFCLSFAVKMNINIMLQSRAPCRRNPSCSLFLVILELFKVPSSYIRTVADFRGPLVAGLTRSK